MMESVMPKGYIKIESAADSWQISRRRVQALCAAGRIPGALRVGRDWMIPAGSIRPVDGRTKAGRAAPGTEAGADQPLPRKTPFLYMSDLYHTPGTAEACAARLCDHHEAEVLFRAEVAYSRGEIDKVYESASYLLQKHSGFYAILSAGMLLAMCAIWKGDLAMWRRAKVHISEAPAKSDFDRDMMQLAISAVDIMLYNVTSFPDWFKLGSFEALHRDALPSRQGVLRQVSLRVGLRRCHGNAANGGRAGTFADVGAAPRAGAADRLGKVQSNGGVRDLSAHDYRRRLS